MADSRQREPTRQEILDAVLAINRKAEDMSDQLTALETKLAEIEHIDEEIVAAVDEAVSEIKAAEQEIETLKASGVITDAQLKPLVARVGGVSTGLSGALSALQEAFPPPAPRPPATPQSVYLFVGEGQPSGSEWTAAPFVTAGPEPGKTLYYFAGDTAGAEPPTTNGVGQPGWELYTGPVTP